ncbi:MAG: hypothetical protein HN548_13625 [Opitutae bacterium]|nr:hypothetical protein [Opitutae bacterium]MBT5716398.1 hypothetical protein [Opitutae bacterium]
MVALSGTYHLARRITSIRRGGKGSRVKILNNTRAVVFNCAGYETFRICKNGNSYLVDSSPTFCDIAGISIPATTQGISLKAVLIDNN